MWQWPSLPIWLCERVRVPPRRSFKIWITMWKDMHLKFVNIFPNRLPEGLWTFYAPADGAWEARFSCTRTNTGRCSVTIRQTSRYLATVTHIFLSSSEVGKMQRFFANCNYKLFHVFLFEFPVHFLCSLLPCPLLICRFLKIDLYSLSRIANMLSRLVVLTSWMVFCFAFLYRALDSQGIRSMKLLVSASRRRVMVIKDSSTPRS